MVIIEMRTIIFSTYFRRWIASWLDLIDGLIGIFTLGIVRPNLCFKFATKQAKKAMNKGSGRLTEGKMKGGNGFIKLKCRTVPNKSWYSYRPTGPPPLPKKKITPP